MPAPITPSGSGPPPATSRYWNRPAPSICIRGDPGQARRPRFVKLGRVPSPPRPGRSGWWCVSTPSPLPAHEQVLVRLYEGWRAAGARVAGIQIDFDAATRQLDRYGNALQQLRRALPPGCKLSVTGLLDWAKTGTWQSSIACPWTSW